MIYWATASVLAEAAVVGCVACHPTKLPSEAQCLLLQRATQATLHHCLTLTVLVVCEGDGIVAVGLTDEPISRAVAFMLKAQHLCHLVHLGDGADEPLGSTLMPLIQMTVAIGHVGIVVLQGGESCLSHCLVTERLGILATVNPHCLIEEQVAVVAGGMTVEHLKGSTLATCRQTHFDRDIFGVVAGHHVAGGHHEIDVPWHVLAAAWLALGDSATEVMISRSSVAAKVEHRSVCDVCILVGQQLNRDR